ncbi:MAG TPA: hypothetical protein VM219_08880 [Phycisphaerae bacterium]|nr:hypothetical protein [Phycisphaerae bacterium]
MTPTNGERNPHTFPRPGSAEGDWTAERLAEIGRLIEAHEREGTRKNHSAGVEMLAILRRRTARVRRLLLVGLAPDKSKLGVRRIPIVPCPMARRKGGQDATRVG